MMPKVGGILYFAYVKYNIPYDAALRLQGPWVNGLSDELAIKDIETAHGVILALRQKLDGNDGPEA